MTGRLGILLMAVVATGIRLVAAEFSNDLKGWKPTGGNESAFRFFKVGVEMPE